MLTAGEGPDRRRARHDYPRQANRTETGRPGHAQDAGPRRRAQTPGAHSADRRQSPRRPASELEEAGQPRRLICVQPADHGGGMTAVRRTSPWRANGLSLVLAGVFLACLVGQVWTGHLAFNAEQARNGQAAIGLATYLGSGHFLSALFENWESE